MVRSAWADREEYIVWELLEHTVSIALGDMLDCLLHETEFGGKRGFGVCGGSGCSEGTEHVTELTRCVVELSVPELDEVGGAGCSECGHGCEYDSVIAAAVVLPGDGPYGGCGIGEDGGVG